MDTSILKSFGILYRTYINYISHLIQNEDISFSDCVFLSIIANKSDKGKKCSIHQEDISNELFIDKAAIARSVKKMEQKGFLVSEKTEEDKRIKDLVLTKEGLLLAKKITKYNEKWLSKLLENYSEKEISSFYLMISTISKSAINNSK